MSGVQIKKVHLSLGCLHGTQMDHISFSPSFLILYAPHFLGLLEIFLVDKATLQILTRYAVFVFQVRSSQNMNKKPKTR